MWHELVEKEMAAARNAAHVLWDRIDHLILARRARPVAPAPPAASPPESPAPRVETPPEVKPPVV